MRVFKLRERLNQRGLLLLERGPGWLITNNGTVKSLIEHTFDDLDQIEKWVDGLPNRMTEEEGVVFDEMFKDFVVKENGLMWEKGCGKTNGSDMKAEKSNFIKFCEAASKIVEAWPEWKRNLLGTK